VTVTNTDGQVSNAYNIAVVAGTQPITVSVSPASVTLRTRQTQTFVATVSNTSNKAVTWRVNGIVGGSVGVGFITSSGVYTAPARVPWNPTVTVTAVSVADSTKSGSATVTVVR
jgi:hypothetical protein